MKGMRYLLKMTAVSVVIAMAAAFSLPAVAQNPYARDNHSQMGAPNHVFQSTSTMSGSGSSYSASPMLNSNGTAAYNGATYAPSRGPRRAKMEDPDPSNPFYNETTGENENIGDTGTPNEPGTPIGDAVLPLMLMAIGYMVWKRRRREERKEGYHPSKEYRQMPE